MTETIAVPGASVQLSTSDGYTYLHDLESTDGDVVKLLFKVRKILRMRGIKTVYLHVNERTREFWKRVGARFLCEMYELDV